MGYVDPQQNIKGYLNVMNRKTQEIGDAFDLQFNELNQEMRTNIASNVSRIKEEKLKKQVGSQAYYELVKAEGEKIGGYKDMNDAFLRNLGDQAYDLYGDDSLESIKKLGNIEKTPHILAQLQGVYMQIQGDLTKSLQIEGANAGAFNAATNRATVGFVTPNNNMRYELMGDGSLEVSYDYAGQTYTKSARELIEMGLENGIGIETLGDPSAQKQKIHDGVWKDRSYDQAYKVLNGKGANPDDAETWNIYEPVNKMYKETISNEDLYEPTIADASQMRGYWPVIVNDAYKSVKDGDPGSEKYKSILEQVLSKEVLGDDGLLNTADDGEIPSMPEDMTLGNNDYSQWLEFYTNQGQAGVWNYQNDYQKQLALTWFGTIAPDNKHIKEDRLKSVTEDKNRNTNLKNQKLIKEIADGSASAEQKESYRNDVRTWLKNSHDVEGTAPNKWGNFAPTQYFPTAEPLIPEMDRWLNSVDGLSALGRTPPKDSKFAIKTNGKVVIVYNQTNDDGDIVEEETGIILKPGSTFDSKVNINTIINEATNQYRKDSKINANNDPNNPAGI